jgi:hypothetical protein
MSARTRSGGVWSLLREVAVAAVSEAVTGHVDRRPEPAVVGQVGEVAVLLVAQHRLGDRVALLVESGAQRRPVQGVYTLADVGSDGLSPGRMRRALPV